MKINWREVFKFLSGAAFAGTIANGYLWFSRVSVPFFDYTLTPRLFGYRAIAGVILFVTFFYFAWLRK